MSNNADLVDQSLIGTFRYFGLQEMQIDKVNYYLIHTGCNHPVWNMIVLPDKVNVAQMDRMEEVFKLKNLLFAWWIDEKNLSSEMLEHFQNDKYTDFDAIGMIYELKDYHEQNIDNKNRHLSKPAYREEFKGDTEALATAAYTSVREDASLGSTYKLPLEAKFGKMSNIKIITEIEEYKEWIRVLIRSFGFSGDVYDVYFDNLSKFIGNNKIFIPLAAYEENKIVATASITFANGIAGFYHDSTMPEYRNRGLASDLYRARFKILKEMGVDKAVVQTSPMATSLAEKLGFKKYTNYKIYCQS